MSTTPYSAEWNGVTKLIHWTFVVIILTMAILGLTMDDIDSPGTKITVIAFHKSLGMTALALAAVRLVWRLISKDPPKITTIPTWQHLAAKVTHAMIYVFLFVMPLSGWVMNSAKGYRCSGSSFSTFLRSPRRIRSLPILRTMSMRTHSGF